MGQEKRSSEHGEGEKERGAPRLKDHPSETV